MTAYAITASPRTQFGRKTKALRNEGFVPATVYGQSDKSISVSVPTAVFDKLYQSAGETGLVELTVGSDKLPVLIHHVQSDPVRGTTLHVEFFQVNLKEKVKANVPLELAGESPAVNQKTGVLLSVLNEVEVEALPAELPEKLSVDVSALAEVGQEIKVSGLTIPAGVTVLTDPELVVVKVSPLVSKEAEEQAAAEAAEAAEAAAPAEGAEGEQAEAAPATEEKKEEKAPEA